MPSRRALDTVAAAHYLGITPRSLGDWRRRGAGPRFTKTTEGRTRYLYLIDALDDWLATGVLTPRFPATSLPPPETRAPRPLTNVEWWKLEEIVPRFNDETRHFIDAVLYLVWTDRPWHLLPLEYGVHKKVRELFHIWANRGIWHNIFAALSDDPAFPYRYIKRESICVANLAATGHEEIITGYMLDCRQETVGEYKVPFRTQRRYKQVKFPTIPERLNDKRR